MSKHHPPSGYPSIVAKTRPRALPIRASGSVVADRRFSRRSHRVPVKRQMAHARNPAGNEHRRHSDDRLAEIRHAYACRMLVILTRTHNYTTRACTAQLSTRHAPRSASRLWNVHTEPAHMGPNEAVPSATVRYHDPQVCCPVLIDRHPASNGRLGLPSVCGPALTRPSGG